MNAAAPVKLEGVSVTIAPAPAKAAAKCTVALTRVVARARVALVTPQSANCALSTTVSRPRFLLPSAPPSRVVARARVAPVPATLGI